MTYDRSKDFAGKGNASSAGSARNWYPLLADHIGAKELPVYGRALRCRFTGSITGSIKLLVVPVGEPDDEQTRELELTNQIINYPSLWEPVGVRRIVSINGQAAIPAGLGIDIITE